MGHADTLTARTLFLDGHPNMQKPNPPRIRQNVKEIIECDLADEHEARTLYLDAAKYCDSVNGRATKNLFEKLVQMRKVPSTYRSASFI